MDFQQPQIDFTPEELLLYLRKSQSDDPLLTVEEVLEKHEQMLDSWCDKVLGSRVPEHNRFREVVSGETLRERPEANKILRLAESNRYRAILVVDPQRWTRGDLQDIGFSLKFFKTTNTLFITPDRIFDLHDEWAWNALETEFRRGNDYLNYYKKIQNRGRLVAVQDGCYIGSQPPYGYDKTYVMEGRKKRHTLKENPEEANVVRMIFDMYVNNDMGRPSICYRLDELGVQPPRGDRWSPPYLKDLLQNVHYIGKVKWYWKKQIDVFEDGEFKRVRKKTKPGEYLVFEGRHEGIISEELFEAAQEKQRRNHRAKSSTKVRNPLAGLLFCRCGRAMSLRYYNCSDGSQKSPPRLLCDDQRRCNTGSVLYEEMLSRVASILEQCIEDFEIKVAGDDGTSIKLHAQLIQRLQKKLTELEARELSQWEQQSSPDPDQRMPAAIFKKLNEKVIQEKEETKKSLELAYETMPEPVDYGEQVKRFKDALDALKDPNADAQHQNNLLKACIERIDYSREKPQRIPSQQIRYYDKEQKRTRTKSPLPTGGNWTSPPIELDVKLKV